MTIISLLNRKGGAGKTTASVNLASIFALSKNKKVLLVDIDPQANATTYLDKFISKDGISVYDVICKDLPAEEAVIDTDIDGLKLIPSNVNLDKADTVLTTMPMAKEFVLKKKLLKGSEKLLPSYKLNDIKKLLDEYKKKSEC